jgi:hypothetical protein
MGAGHDEPAAGGLLAGEQLMACGTYQALSYVRADPPGRPLVLFLPGGGHLARVAYGNPGAARQDFLDYWIGAAGYPVLAVSYPSDHPVFAGDVRGLTVSEWAAVLARTARAVIDQGSLQAEVIVLAWSMAGRMAVALNRAARTCGLRIRCFVSLAATAPIPGLAGGAWPAEALTGGGLWALAGPDAGPASRAGLWQAELRRQGEREGREIMSWPSYERWNRCHTPLNLRGEGNRMTPAGPRLDIGLTMEDLGSVSFGDYPPVAAITPTSKFDARHALTDSATWMLLAAQRIAARLASPAQSAGDLPEEAWSRLRQIIATLPARLTAAIAGGHLFFLGATGASQTARLALTLADAAAAVDEEVSQLLARTSESPDGGQ